MIELDLAPGEQLLSHARIVGAGGLAVPLAAHALADPPRIAPLVDVAELAALAVLLFVLTQAVLLLRGSLKCAPMHRPSRRWHRRSRRASLHSIVSPITLRIRELRERRGWSQAELAHRAKVAPSTVNRIERGETRSLTFGSLERLARALGVAPKSLFR